MGVLFWDAPKDNGVPLGFPSNPTKKGFPQKQTQPFAPKTLCLDHLPELEVHLVQSEGLKCVGRFVGTRGTRLPGLGPGGFQRQKTANRFGGPLIVRKTHML